MTVVIATTTQASVTVTENGAITVVPTVSSTGVEVNQAGVPPGGNPKDLLIKSSSTDYHSEWTATPEVNALHFDLTADYSVEAGQLAWNPDELTVDIGKGNGVTLQVGSEQLMLVRNGGSVTIPNGTAVMFTGTIGNSGRIVVAPMVADGSFPGYVFFGVTTQAIDAGEDGFATTFGKVRQVNTIAFEEGDILWCNPAAAGGFTKTEPAAPNLKLPVAAVISKATNGIIMVRSDTGRRLMDLHDVEANGSKSNGDLINWNATAGRWEPTDRLTLLEARVTALEAPTYIITE